MVFVEQILSKGGVFWSVAPDAMVIDALKLMAEKDVGRSWSWGQAIGGIISERDYAGRSSSRGRRPADPVREIMTQVVVTVRPGTP